MPVSDSVGVEVLEAMRGEVTRVSTGGVEEVRFSTTQVIRSLNRFAQGPHLCEVSGGNVEWRDGLFPRKFSITGGTIEMFRATHPPSVKEKCFEFRIEFKGPGGAPYLLHGFKDLVADGAVQALDALTDLSTLRRVALIDLTRPNAPIATGTMRVALPDLTEQLGSLRFPGAASSDEREAAQQDFLAFMNNELAEVYSVMPLFFAKSRSILWHQHLLVALLLEVFIPGAKAASPAQVIEQLEKYLVNSSTSIADWQRVLVQLSGGNLAQLDPTSLRTVVRRILDTRVTNGVEKLVRDAVQSMHMLVVAAYYACSSVDGSIGYQRPAMAAGPGSPPLSVKSRPVGQYDVVIAGSGVAGSLLAHRLAKAGKKVCLLESGRVLREADVTNNELDGLSRAYMRGGLQTARDVGRPVEPAHLHRDVTVLQARAVGGGGLVNNAVCFRLPQPVFERWRNIGFPIDADTLNAAYDAVAQELGIIPVRQALAPGARANPAASFVERAWGTVQQHPAGLPNKPGLYECNVNLKSSSCRGCGLCNAGCSFEAKRNSLQVHLREAVDTGNVDIVPLARAQRFIVSGSRVEGVEVLLGGTERLTVKGKQYVSACGPLHSSALLKRSGLTDQRIGTRLSANIGAPVMAFYQQPVHSPGSLQISHFYWPDEPGPRFVIESWFNPPAAHAMVTPGYLEAHQARMQRFANVVVMSPIIGTLASGTVDAEGNAQLPIGRDDLARLHQGHVAIGRALMQPGGTHTLDRLVMPTHHGIELADAASLTVHETQFTALRDLVVGTGHPQGGNPMSTDKWLDVVGPDFRVKGMDNLRVCDGSLFPDCATINPQWTIMALAHLCGQHLASVA